MTETIKQITAILELIYGPVVIVREEDAPEEVREADVRRKMMFDEKQCCGTCAYNCHESASDNFFCGNQEGEYYAEYTEYDDCCEDWWKK